MGLEEFSARAEYDLYGPLRYHFGEWLPAAPANAEDVRRNLGYTLAFANRIDLASMTPQLGLASTAYCLAKPGSEYLVYQPSNGAFTVDLQAGTYIYEWFRPETGTAAGKSSLTVGRTSKSRPLQRRCGPLPEGERGSPVNSRERVVTARARGYRRSRLGE